jgi:hypothetical protein
VRKTGLALGDSAAVHVDRREGHTAALVMHPAAMRHAPLAIEEPGVRTLMRDDPDDREDRAR